MLGTAGNHFLRMKQYCQGTDVVVTLHGNSSLIGRQAFNIINAVFQEEDTWLAFFSPLRMQDSFYKATDPINVKGNFRKQVIETDNYLTAYRYSLAEKLPIEHVMEFNRDAETGYLKPTFYQTDSNTFHVYAFAEMCGSEHIRSIDTPIYFYNKLAPLDEKCWHEKQEWTKTKALLKYPLKPLKDISSLVEIDMLTKVPNESMNKIKQSYQELIKCRNQ